MDWLSLACEATGLQRHDHHRHQKDRWMDIDYDWQEAEHLNQPPLTLALRGIPARGDPRHSRQVHHYWYHQIDYYQEESSQIIIITDNFKSGGVVSNVITDNF